MQQSFWGTFVVSLGVLAIILVYLFQSLTNVNEHNYNLLKETTEAAMIDAFDLPTYRKEGIIRIDREKFVENFVRRVAETASLGQTYNIKIYDVVETPPKVSIQISSTDRGSTGSEIVEFDIVNRISAILETPH